MDNIDCIYEIVKNNTSDINIDNKNIWEKINNNNTEDELKTKHITILYYLLIHISNNI